MKMRCPEGDVWVAGRRGASSDDDVGGAYVALPPAVHVSDPEGMRPHKRAFRGQHFDAVAHQLVARDVNFVADHMVGAEQQVIHRDVLLDGVRRAVHPALAVAGEVQHGLAQRLAGGGPAVDAHPADHGFALDEGHALVQFGSLDRRALSGRAGADHHHVVVIFWHRRLRWNGSDYK